MIMKSKFKYIASLLLIATSCMVDDYQDANPPHPLDGPAGFLSTEGKAIVDTETDGNSYTYVPIAMPGIFKIDLVDVPGLIDSVGITLSDEEGEITEVNMADKGKETGSITVTYLADVVGTEDIAIDIFDGQQPRKSITFTPDRIKRVNATCFSSRPLVGFYETVTNGHDSETGLDYTNLESVVEFRINAGGVNHPGLYRLTDGSFGLYGEQGFAANLINVNVCDNAVTNANEEFAGKFTGTLNADGTITITWSNTFGDTGTTIMTPR
jgi:hypothetical protein